MATTTTSFCLNNPWTQADFDQLDTFFEEKEAVLKVLVVSQDGQGTPARWYTATSEEDLRRQVGVDAKKHEFIFQLLVQSHKGWSVLHEGQRGDWATVTSYEHWDAPFTVVAYIMPEGDSWFKSKLFLESLHCAELKCWGYPILVRYPDSPVKSNVRTPADKREYALGFLLRAYPHLAGRFATKRFEFGFLHVLDADVPDLIIESRCDPALEIKACEYVKYMQCRNWFEKYAKDAKKAVVKIGKKVGGGLQTILSWEAHPWRWTHPWSFTLGDDISVDDPPAPPPPMLGLSVFSSSGYDISAHYDTDDTEEKRNWNTHPIPDSDGFAMLHLDLDNDTKYVWGNLEVYSTPSDLLEYLMFSKVCTDYDGEVLLDRWVVMPWYETTLFPVLNGRGRHHAKPIFESFLASGPCVQPLDYLGEMRVSDALKGSKITLNTRLQLATFAHMARCENGLESSMEEILYSIVGGNEDYDLLVSPYYFDMVAVRPKDAPKNVMRGGLLIAPCGWGKTVVSLALLSRSPVSQKTLIVCPPSLVAQWKIACEAMTHLACVIVESKTKETAAIMDADVVIITYSQLLRMFPCTGPRCYDNLFTYESKSRDPVASSKPQLAGRFWDRVIFDESHVLTQKQALYSQNIKTGIRWGLTATPVPDSPLCMAPQIAAIWAHHPSESNICRQSHLANRTFLERCCINVRVEPNQEELWSVSETTIHVTPSPEVVSRMAALRTVLNDHGWEDDKKMASLLLRKVCAGIPGVKVPNMVRASVKRSIAKVYDDEGEGEEENHCPICIEDFVDPVATIPCGHVFCAGCMDASLKHKRVCPQCRTKCNGYLPRKEALELIEKNARMMLVEGEASGSGSGSVQFDPYRVLKGVDLLGRMAPGDKTLVFSQYEMPLACMAAELMARGIGYERFDTKSSVEQRREVLESFISNPDVAVLLLNLRLANAGLNLMAANKIIFLESCASADIRTQAIGRANRTDERCRSLYID